jgi:xanthine dehydrogenase YagT iron-sulfur-binding subunit
MRTPHISRRSFIKGSSALGGTLAVGLPHATAVDRGQSTEFDVSVSLSVNGIRHHLRIDPRLTLLNLLREQLGLPGTKKGCDRGQCGVCTVLVNGRRINSCLSLAAGHDGDSIVTIEGLADSSSLHPVQEAFLLEDGFQCGYCTPGQICSAVALLDEWSRHEPSVHSVSMGQDRQFSRLEIRERMSGNLCRCSAYANIVSAIEMAHRRISRS